MMTKTEKKENIEELRKLLRENNFEFVIQEVNENFVGINIWVGEKTS